MRHIAMGICASLAFCGAMATAAIAAPGFEVKTTAFADGEIMESKFAAKGGPRECDGENIQPSMAWTHVPEGTKSFAIVTMDDVGEHGQGVIHWVLYNIPGDIPGFGEGIVPEGATGGPNIIGRDDYLGPCPDVGDVPHHYEFMLFALDLEIGELPAGLDWPSLKKAVKGRTLGTTSIVGRYARN